MFKEHAEALVEKGYRCILVDLPGHGALINQEFTLSNCLRVIESIQSEVCTTSSISAVGCSFGALALIHYLAAHECAFKKLILLSCCFKLYSSNILSPVYSREGEGARIISRAYRKTLRVSTFMGVLTGGLYPLMHR
jgi:alpha-beta hydrolase superfamily lysophospholipase